jgi:hypothetical protein
VLLKRIVRVEEAKLSVVRARAFRVSLISAAWALVVGCGEGAAIGRSSGGGAGGRSEDGGTGGVGGGEAGSSPTVRCVDVSHVGPLQKKGLEVIGTGFDAYEGLMIRIIATLGEPAYGLGEAPIADGAFDIVLPGVLGDYTGIAIHVDRVRDDTCNPADEFIWQQATGPMSAWGPTFSTTASGGAVWKVTPDTLRVFEQAGPCNINGIFDLAIPLPCPSKN